MTEVPENTSPAPERAAHPLDLPAMAALGAYMHATDGQAVATLFADFREETRADWRAVADAVRMAVAMGESDLLALVDKATRDHADVGLPGEVRRANANRAAVGLDLLPVPGEDASGEPAPAGEGGVLFPAGCDPDAAGDDFDEAAQ